MFGFARELAAIAANERQVIRKQEKAVFTGSMFTIEQDHSFRDFLGKKQRGKPYM